MSVWSDLLAAIQFSTRLPVPVYSHDVSSLSRASKFFPLVGLAIGAAGAGIYLGLLHLANSQIRALVVLIFFALITGGLHEDGLADAADGFGGGWTRERVLEIMRDSRVGSFGSLALALSVLTRFVLLSNLTVNRIWPYLISAHVLCRWSSLPLGLFLAPARQDSGSGVKLAGRISWATMIFATVLVAAVEVMLLGSRAWRPSIVAILVTLLSGFYYWRRLGGVTGDCFGATNQLVEVSTYFCGCLWM